MRRLYILIMIVGVMLAIGACSEKKEKISGLEGTITQSQISAAPDISSAPLATQDSKDTLATGKAVQTLMPTAMIATSKADAQTTKPTKRPARRPTKAPTSAPLAKATLKPAARKITATRNPDNAKYIICIDPGHQKRQNTSKEPIGPGSSVMKAKVSSGTEGVVTKATEYNVNLLVSQKLNAELLARGYKVIMTRESNDVNISNAERAQIANNANADAFVRIHCDSINVSSVHGASTLCQTSSNPYCGKYYTKSNKLATSVLNGLCNNTGAKNRGVTKTDSMSGINWCTVPVAIVEMGFMSNADEDRKLADDSYQNLLAEGIAKGIDSFFR